MTGTFLLIIDTEGDTDLQNIAVEIQEKLSADFNVKSCRPYVRPTLSPPPSPS